MESDALQYHLAPFREFWQASPDDPVERLYSEMYTSDVLIEAHESVQNSMPNCKLEKVVIPLMLWSDSTQLASFGTASLWPIYLFFGNLSKYVRAKPSSFSAHHIAYIPKVSSTPSPDCQGEQLCLSQFSVTFQDWYRNQFRTAASAAVMSHCKRELVHAIWLLMMDDAFVEMYRDGMVCEFADHVFRRAFLRFVTHSADYPEK
jgi:hypothetical protein